MEPESSTRANNRYTVKMKYLVIIIVAIMRILNILIVAFISIFGKKKEVVPPITDKTLMISAKKLAILIRQGKLSSEEVVQRYIKRIQEVNPLINAVIDDRFEKALQEAKFVDHCLKSGVSTEEELRNIKPLLGVPITVKVSCKVLGLDFSVGVNSRRGLKAPFDSYTVSKLKSKGAIPILVSNTPEACMSWYCYNKISGTTCNPYDITRISGGSSGGEGALLGAGASLIGIGSDVGGSIRIPAMLCGVFGHKPTPRMTCMEGHYPYPTGPEMLDYFTMGPMTRYAEDLKFLMELMRILPGSDNLRLEEKVDLKKLRIYCMPEIPKSYFVPNVDVEIKKAINQAAMYLAQQSGCTLMTENNLGNYFHDSFLCSMSLIMELRGLSDPLKQENRCVVIELIKELFGLSNYTICYLITIFLQTFIRPTQMTGFRKMNEDLKKYLLEELRDDGVLICPSYTGVAPKHSQAFFKFLDLTYLPVFNTLGFPATQVPCGRGYKGLPIGFQVVAAPKQDRLCFAVAEELEKCFGGWLPPQSNT
ncbi:hypothetical protein WA026_007337 [Henosepilachna vigintioctopunctata]|uniref:Amidase domain-containing protein n=1 Tax=Henosepilachna vigintioctopunctata TaxID=420089 RepID=A0AAW1UUN1_9CUCU